MEEALRFIYVVACSSLWLSVSGLVLWLCLRGSRRLSPGTRSAASILVVLQGWNWVAIPIELAPGWSDPAPFDISSPSVAPTIDVDRPTGQTPDSRPSIIPSAAPDLKRMAGVAAGAIWIGGIAVVLGRSVGGYWALSRMVRSLPPAPAQWQNELAALCGQQTRGCPIALKISNVASPMLVQTGGSACIVFPEWLWRACTAQQRACILRHELAHYRRRDVWRQLAVRLLVLPHWFNPVAWWAARQYEMASEAACDEAACGGDALQAIAYSKALLILKERMGVRYAHALAVSGGPLTQRIRRVLQFEFRKESKMSRFMILTPTIALIGLAAVRIQAEDELSRRQPEPAQASAESLLPNGGFEETQAKSSDPQSWFATRVPQMAGHFLLSVSPSLARGGQRSAVVTIGDNHPDLQVAYNWTADAQGWQAGETYELSGWIKADNARRSAVIVAQFLSENGQRMLGGATTEPSCPIVGTTEWTRVAVRFTVPESTRILRVRASLPSRDNAGATAWFDDLSLVKVAD